MWLANSTSPNRLQPKEYRVLNHNHYCTTDSPFLGLSDSEPLTEGHTAVVHSAEHGPFIAANQSIHSDITVIDQGSRVPTHEQEATRGGLLASLLGAIGRYERGSWPYTTRNKKLLGTRASLLVTSASLLVTSFLETKFATIHHEKEPPNSTTELPSTPTVHRTVRASKTSNRPTGGRLQRRPTDLDR